MSSLRFPIVGMKFHPPATALVSVLGVNTWLSLRPEPFNNFDPNAKSVWVRSVDINQASRDAFFKLTECEVAGQEEWMLGYIPADMACQDPIVSITTELPGTFDLSTKGGPRIRVEISQ